MEGTENIRFLLRELLAIVALVLWSVQLLPQVYKNHKSKSTTGLSAWAFILWALANVLVASNSYVNQVVLPIFLQPQVFCILSLVCLTQCFLYPDKVPSRSPWEGGLLLVALVVLCASLGSLWTYFVLTSNWRNQLWFSLLVGSIGPAITSIGFVPQIHNIILLKSTDGISLLFICLDIGGGVAALISLALHDKFELTVALMYMAVLTMELILIVLHIYYSFTHQPKSRSGFSPLPRNPHHIAIPSPIYPTASGFSYPAVFPDNASRPT
ncbi:hypothetical protein DSO57_1002747 [Entomophthora muscae]|uniref:Uncharacterized protein n=1 Tax=Entomophthora muscae TaxID=34485 RepID=A0ACC2UUL1_9FUNG|nr:hypothetical protein DSO57_1002747 [Entomophthora muscae]